MNCIKKIQLLFIAILTLGVTMSLCACAGTERWKEEVQLSDGRIIVVERETVREQGGDEIVSNRSGTKPKEYRIRLTLPDGSGKIIEWRSIKKSPGTYPEKPLIFDIESGQPIVFTSVFNSGGCDIYSKYYYQNSVWVEEKLPERFEKRLANLLIREASNMPEFVDLETKRKENTNIRCRREFQHVGPNRQVCG